jgi:deoxyribodipyrimidine photolyase-related protein
MSILRVILADQLSEKISSLSDMNKEEDIVMLCEVIEEASYVKHHKKKLVFLFSAMRHFALSLEKSGFNVLYTKIDENVNSYEEVIRRTLSTHKITKIIIAFPGEYRILEKINSWHKLFQVEVELREDNRFLSSIDEFKIWAGDRKQLRMEYFYRFMRKKHNILIDGDNPEGDSWNYDSENRKIPGADVYIPKPYQVETDQITKEVIKVVGDKFASHFGDMSPFNFAVTRIDALSVLDHFIKNRLDKFGDFQDAMIENEPWMFHSHLSFYLNCGLLEPLECVLAAQSAYYQKKASLNNVEGFIRQILGWREYIRGIYWLKMPRYAHENFLSAAKNLPQFYWTANTKMNCLKQCIKETKENAYAHHIQRLMVLGNFALLAGIDPRQVNEWFLIVYADAYEWVELPNVSGMVLFADGGLLASKPYVAGGSYINKMSNYCKNCKYNVVEKNGVNACPFNYLYWHFLISNRDKLSSNPRISMMYKVIDKMDEIKKENIIKDSKKFLESI